VLIAVVFLLGAIACLAATVILLRSLGPRYRVGRLLASTPVATIDEALELARGRDAYVRVTGRISSDEEFPDENDRPLVYRRKRLEVADRPGTWRVVADEREAVPFGIETRSSFIAVDEAAIAEGLVAIPREAAGRSSDLPTDIGDALKGVDPNAPARLVVEQLSAVEHATVCGVPLVRHGRGTLSAGLDRPLIVTTLDVPDAIRLLAAPNRRRVVTAAGFLLAAVVQAALAVVAALAGL
jgi:hypothetical protein